MSLASISGHDCESVRLYVPQSGAWYAEVLMLTDPGLSGQVTLVIGSLECVGTITSTGTRGEQQFLRLAAGAGAWGTALPPKGYQSDARVKARTVAADAARECGETLDLVTAADLGTYYVRRAGPASRALEGAVGTAWYVGMDGVTRVGARAGGSPARGSYTVVDVQPEQRLARLAMDDMASVSIGMTLSEGLDAPMVVREIEIHVDAGDAFMVVWGGAAESGDRLGNALRALVGRETAREVYGLWRYRVSEMSGERVKLQAVSAAAGLPDILPVDMYPGLAGAHAELALGGEVLVQFIEGDPTMPVITQFAGRRGPGHVPTVLTIDASTRIDMGAGATQFVALAQDVLDRLNAMKTAYDAHTHAYLPGPGASTPTAVPIPLLPSPAPVAATLVRAE